MLVVARCSEISFTYAEDEGVGRSQCSLSKVEVSRLTAYGLSQCAHEQVLLCGATCWWARIFRKCGCLPVGCAGSAACIGS